MDLPQASVAKQQSALSIVWLIPLVALIIGGWLAYRAVSQRGPEITIIFGSAEGLEAGKTKIKYKEVELGKVEGILLSPDRIKVIVTAKLSKQSESLLSKNTRFWVVRPRIAASGVSGLGTLLSGAYIAMDPGIPGKAARNFEGLDIPPIVTTDLPGKHFYLETKRKGSLYVGAPIYYRQMEAGQVVAYELTADGEKINITVFINEPYDQFVYGRTRFWQTSGFEMSLDAEGIQVNTESMVAMLMGGIAFDLPEGIYPQAPADQNQVFELYPTYRASQEVKSQIKKQFLLYFEGSMRGLSPGAPVEFRGIPVGKVLDVKLEFDEENVKMRVPVLIEIEAERFVSRDTAEALQEEYRFMEQMVSKGLRAQLRPGNILTGQQLVAFDFYPDDPPETVIMNGKYPQLPTKPAAIEELGSKLNRILNRIENLPIEQIGSDLSATIQGAKDLVEAEDLRQAIASLNLSLDELRQLMGSLNREVAPRMATALSSAEEAIEAAGATLSADSTLQNRMIIALDEIAAAARSLKNLTDYLERHPEALLQGKGKGN